MPKLKPKVQVIVEVRGGCVVAVHASSKDVQVELLDWDNVAQGAAADKEAADVLEKTAEGMHEVF